MTDRTFTLTIEHIKQIFEAGVRRGQEEQSAFEWGSHPTGRKYSECIDALYNIVYEDKEWGEGGWKGFEEVESWFKETE
jgi:hypothetical protein